ncbi:PIG-L family deacetylase [SAR202 cluster bacterium AC-409-J13_OGT_754m]|nr:PIG-L family deacetylase [SAR202 cluster bacterium AC-409-J13_OGT_754m]
MQEIPSRALVVIPHPDDGEIACGGTIAKWAQNGTEIAYVLCTNGNKGTDDPSMTTADLEDIRYKEQVLAAKTLGVETVFQLGHPDGELEDSREFRGQLVRVIRSFRPEVVFAPDPYRRTFYFHRDHRIAGIVAQDAVFPYARDRLHFAEHEQEGFEPHKVKTLLFWGAEEVDADTYFDITESIDLKIQALICHSSQISGLSESDSTDWLRNWNREIGLKCGFKYAEEFRKVTFPI